MSNLKENISSFLSVLLVVFVVVISVIVMNSCSPKNPLHSTTAAISGNDNNGSGGDIGGGTGGGSSSNAHSTVVTFDAGNDLSNEWAGAQGIFSDKDEDVGSATTVSIGYSSSDDATGNGKYAVYMDYNVVLNTNLGYQYAGFYVAAPGLRDITKYQNGYIIFRIKGQNGNENIYAVLRETSGSGGTRLEEITYSHVPAGAITASYQWCKIKISDMTTHGGDGTFDYTQLDSFQIKCVQAGENSRVYIDDIYFSTNTNTL